MESQEMIKKFYKYNLNPITGHPTPKVLGGQGMGIETLKINKPSRNKYSN